MNALATITSEAAKQNLPFLVAGGHAVIVHGHPRTTFDLDIIISRSDREKWIELANCLGYSVYREGPTFLQLNPKQSSLLPLDLMFVNPDTFAKLLADAVPAPASSGGAKVVSLNHLFALKCHAIKHGQAGRIVKDADDVIRLVQVNNIDLNSANIRELFLKHGLKNSMKKSRQLVVAPEKADLDFPDWSGMDYHAKRLDADSAFHFCEEYPAWFPELLAKWRSRTQEKCVVEFVL